MVGGVSKEMQTIAEYFSRLPYPGRVIISGYLKDGMPFSSYIVMGRSVNSRNRVIKKHDDGFLYTEPYDESKVEDPSLIIYRATGKAGSIELIANGKHIEDIEKALSSGKDIIPTLAKIHAEPDAPNYTPRIFSYRDAASGDITFGIARKDESLNDIRTLWHYKKMDGMLHAIHTYESNGSPLPPFSKDPVLLSSHKDAKDLMEELFMSLNKENLVSMAVKAGDEEWIKNIREGGNGQD